MSRKPIYLVVSTGHPNYGDELVAAQWLRYLAKHEPDADVWLDSPSPGNSQLLLGHLHPRVRFVDTLFRICWAGPGEDPAEIVEFGAEAIRNPGLVPRHAVGVELLHGADVFHILGGGYINSIWPRHLSFFGAGSVLTARHDTRAAMTGVGLVPSAAARRRCSIRRRRRSRCSTFATLPPGRSSRNEAVTDSGDDAFLELGDEIYDERRSRSVMISAQSDMLRRRSRLSSRRSEGRSDPGRSRATRSGTSRPCPAPTGWSSTSLEPDFPDMRFYPFVELWREGFPARRGQRWITTRFHPHLVAAAAGAWGVAIKVSEDYYGVKHESLLSRGSRWTSVKAGEVAEESSGRGAVSVPPSMAWSRPRRRLRSGSTAREALTAGRQDSRVLTTCNLCLVTNS